MAAVPAATSTADGPSGAPRSRLPGTRVHVLGLRLLALAPALVGVLTLSVGGHAGQAAYTLVLATVLVLAAVGADRAGPWATVVSTVLTVLALPLTAWFLWGLVYPSSPADLVPAVLVLLGAPLALGGGVVANVARVRRRPPVPPSVAGRWLARTAWATVVLSVVGSSVLNLVARAEVDPIAARFATPVVMGVDDFDPPVMRVRGGRHAALLVSNGDVFLHDLTLPDHGVAVVLAPGSQALVDVSHLAPGRYTVYCEIHSDTSQADPELAGMAGSLVVE